jgi:hypothetical protein
MKLFLTIVFIFVSEVSFAGKPAILCRKGATFEEAVGKINSITIDPQWPVEINKISSTSQTTTINAKSIKFDMANFKVSDYEETTKNGSITRKEKVFQACLPIDFD